MARHRRIPLRKVVLGCFPVIAVAAVVWWSGTPSAHNTQVPVAPVYATVDDVYAALSRQMGGATPDFETQVKPTLALHMTYAELQAFVDDGRHAPTLTPAPTPVTAPPAPLITTQPAPPTATQSVAPVVTAPTTQTVTVVSVAWGPCTTPAKGYLPGWINCPGTATLRINRPVSSGFVTVSYTHLTLPTILRV